MGLRPELRQGLNPHAGRPLTGAVPPCRYATSPPPRGGIFLLSLRDISPTPWGNLPGPNTFPAYAGNEVWIAAFVFIKRKFRAGRAVGWGEPHAARPPLSLRDISPALRGNLPSSSPWGRVLTVNVCKTSPRQSTNANGIPAEVTTRDAICSPQVCGLRQGLALGLKLRENGATILPYRFRAAVLGRRRSNF